MELFDRYLNILHENAFQLLSMDAHVIRGHANVATASVITFNHYRLKCFLIKKNFLLFIIIFFFF